jgi:hypothetical protein
MAFWKEEERVLKKDMTRSVRWWWHVAHPSLQETARESGVKLLFFKNE